MLRVIILIVCLAAFAGGGAAATPQPTVTTRFKVTCSAPQNADEASVCEERAANDLAKKNFELTRVAMLVSAFSIPLAAIATIVAGWAAREAARANRISAQAGRPWIGYTQAYVTLIGPLAGATGAKAHIVLTNTGERPALLKICMDCMVLKPAAEDVDLTRPPGVGTSGLVVAPRATFSGQVLELTGPQLREFSEGRGKLRVAHYIEYEDVLQPEIRMVTEVQCDVYWIGVEEGGGVITRSEMKDGQNRMT